MPSVRHVIRAGECSQRLLFLQEVEGTGHDGDDGEGSKRRVVVTMAHSPLMGGRGALHSRACTWSTEHVLITRLLRGSLLVSVTWRAASMEWALGLWVRRLVLCAGSALISWCDLGKLFNLPELPVPCLHPVLVSLIVGTLGKPVTIDYTLCYARDSKQTPSPFQCSRKSFLF